MFENALGNFLLNSVRMSPLVDLRVWPIKMRQGNELACVVYQRIYSGRSHTNAGSSGFVESLYQINCIAKTHKEAKALAEAVRLDLDGFKGSMGTGADVTEVDGVFLEDERDTFDDELSLYSIQLDFAIDFQEATTRD